MTTLDDFKAKPVEVTVKTAYGRELKVRLALPSYHRHREIMSDVPEPKPPLKVNAERKSVPDYESLSYRAAQQERATELNYRVVVDALAGGGMSIPGETLADKTAAFRASNPDAGIVNALSAFIAEAVAGVQRIADDAPFRPVRSDGHEGDPVGSDDTQRVGKSP
jgi:hypothetical protein